MTEMLPAAPRTLIISDNVVEAEDLTDMLSERGLGPVAHARDVDCARTMFETKSDSIGLLIFGLSLHQSEAKCFLRKMVSRQKPLVVIDGRRDCKELDGAGVLLRPFSTNDVLAALKHIGLDS